MGLQEEQTQHTSPPQLLLNVPQHGLDTTPTAFPLEVAVAQVTKDPLLTKSSGHFTPWGISHIDHGLHTEILSFPSSWDVAALGSLVMGTTS